MLYIFVLIEMLISASLLVYGIVNEDMFSLGASIWMLLVTLLWLIAIKD